MTDEDILAEAHRTCTTYCFLGDEKYHFSEDDMLAFAQAIIRPYVQECYSLSLSNAALVQELHELKLKEHTK